MDALLTARGFLPQGTIRYDQDNHSVWYRRADSIVIIDYFTLHQWNELFDYRHYTIEQNKLMRLGLPLYRFLASEDEEAVIPWLDGTVTIPTEYRSTLDRSLSVADASPLEHSFEERFCEVYGSDALQFLNREYPIPSLGGETFALDYLVEYRDGMMIAVEENGVTYHHPQLIGRSAYRTQLEKQNSAAYRGIRLFRFSSMDLAYPDLIDDQIRSFFGNRSAFKGVGLLAERPFSLYDHQVDALAEIEKLRSQSPPPHAVLKVFPTATGKSLIVEEDLKRYLKAHPTARILVVAPSLRIVSDWVGRLERLPITVGDDIDSQAVVGTYHLLWSLQRRVGPDHFSYIVFDEAHHAVAPVTRRSLQYWQCDFLIGLTATPERLDNQRLEEVFGSYKTNLTLQEAMGKGIIASIHAYRIETNLSLERVRFNGKEFINADLERTIRVDSRNHLIADVLATYFTGGEKGIIFCVNVAHTRQMEALLQSKGMRARSITGTTRNVDDIVHEFRFGDLQFLCSCNLLSEGWDVPEVEVLVMARPTLSKVLYQQQLGRGLRRSERKSALYVIDVVDQYGALARPWSVHSLFSLPYYVPFGDVGRTYQVGDIVEVLGLAEEVRALVPVDITTFEEQYAGYLDEEQSARELFIGTSTLKSWVRKGEVEADLVLPMGRRNLLFFHPDSLQTIREIKNLSVHDEETMKEDFFAFIDEKSYTFSFKIIFMLAMLKHVDSHGEAPIDTIVEEYRGFYLRRHEQHLAVDRPSCIYTNEFLQDPVAVKRNMLANPFEKFERKRFVHYVKDLSLIGFNPILFENLSEQERSDLTTLLHEHLREYYEELGGLGDELL